MQIHHQENGFLSRAARFVLLLLSAAATFAGEPTAQQIEFFEQHIRPVLVEHCYDCHASDAKHIRGELLLDSREAIRRGGESGPAVVPGKPEESLLLAALRHESFEMPPDKKLPAEVIDDFAQWIAAGAADPRDGGRRVSKREIDLLAGREFWSFRPLHKPLPPRTRQIHWPATIIDQFVLARLETDDAQLTPNARTDPATLLRRAKFDLLGLPPTVAEIEEFLANPTVDAYAQLVDRWLNSRHFGQRWGRHWLDVARFAESSGGGRSLMYPHAWRYRDYVIDAFNNDLPFDQFVRQQIAGDLLDAPDAATRDRYMIATGFLALGPANYELQDKELLELEIVDEQIDSIGRAFLGLTLGCVRCHDHKFDPIPMTDYYALAGILYSTESVVHANVSKYFEQALTSDAAYAAHEVANRQIASLQHQLQAQQAKTKLVQQKLDEIAGDGVVIDDDQARLTGNWKQSTFVPSFVGEHYLATSERNATATFELNVIGKGLLFVAYAPGSNRSQKVPFVIGHRNGNSTIVIDQRKMPSVGGLYEWLGEFDSPTRVSVATESASAGAVIVDAIRFVPLENGDDGEQAEKIAGFLGQFSELAATVKTTQQRIKQIQSQRPPRPVAMAVQDRRQPGDTHLRIRGEIRNLGPTVPRGFVSIASPPRTDDGRPARLRLDARESGRLELADWIASPDNPLTARVIVNRVWHYLLGEGIVRTPDNFGAMGQLPTHPELLDYLAADFIETGWSIKSLVRRIMLSHVYQLDSHVTQESLRHDPDNRLLARANRRRLDAEAIRDAMLQISGQLEECNGGRTIRKLAEYDLDYEFDTRKRSVYVPRFRNSVLDLFQIFDVANPNLVTGRRPISVLSTQALFLMNSPFVSDQARHAAQRLLELEGTDEARLETAFLASLGRLPQEAERALMRDVVAAELGDDGGDDVRIERWAEVFHLLFGSVDFRYLH